MFGRKETSERTDGVPFFGLYLGCNEESDDPFWRCEHSSKLIFINRLKHENSIHIEVLFYENLITRYLTKSESFLQVKDSFSNDQDNAGRIKCIEFVKLLDANEVFSEPSVEKY